MAKEHLLMDKTEFRVAILNDGPPRMEDVKYSDIINITFRKAEKKSLFGGAQEEIIIKTKKQSITLDQKQEKKFWDGYKKSLEEFCKNNRLTLYNEL